MGLNLAASIRRMGRRALSLLPESRILPPPSRWRPPGLSVLSVVKDEEEWIELALRSVGTIADEIVVIDNGSTDGTAEIAHDTLKRIGCPFKICSYPAEDFCGALNFGIEQTSRQRILRWSGDFIGHTTGSSTLSHLRKRLESLSPNRYYCILLGPVSLDGDLFHQEYQAEIEREPILYTYSPHLRYNQASRFERLSVPYFYQKLDWLDVYFFHMRWVKPADRLLRRWFWTEWMSLPDRTKWPTLIDYVRHKTVAEWGIDDLSEAARHLVNTRCKEFVPYDSTRFGPLPSLLEEQVRHPSFRILYGNGRIIGRSDTLELESPSTQRAQPTNTI